MNIIVPDGVEIIIKSGYYKICVISKIRLHILAHKNYNTHTRAHFQTIIFIILKGMAY